MTRIKGMKFVRLQIFIFLIIFSPFNYAVEKIVHNSANWQVVLIQDDFTDELQCALLSTVKRNIIAFYNKYQVLVFAVSSDIAGVGVKYRVDKNKAVSLGSTVSEHGAKQFHIHGQDYDDIVSAFKNGTSVRYLIYSANPFVDDDDGAASLVGFTKAYALSSACNYKPIN